MTCLQGNLLGFVFTLSARCRGKGCSANRVPGKDSKAQSLVRSSISPCAAGTETPTQPHSNARVLPVHTEADTQTPTSFAKLLCSCMCRRCKQGSPGDVGPGLHSPRCPALLPFPTCEKGTQLSAHLFMIMPHHV